MTRHEVAFVGDVHGCADALDQMLSRVLTRTRRLVMLGDYVNRGPDSWRVLETLNELRQRDGVDVTLLEGNHDVAFRRVLEGSNEDEFLRMGGASTIRSYVPPPYQDVFAQLREAVPSSHLELLNSLDKTWSTDQVIAAHRRPGASHIGGRYVVVGHSVQRVNVPSIGVDTAYIDTGCGTTKDGRLTAFLWPSKEWMQVQSAAE